MRLIICLLLVLAGGCQRRDPSTANPFRQDDSGFVLLIALDPDLIQRNKNIYEFTNHSIDRYFEDRIGEPNDQLIIAGLSGDRQSLIWQGTPLSLREEFRTPDEFHAMVRARCKPGKDQIHDNLIRALQYVQRHRSVARGRAQSAALFLCDLPSTASPADQQLLDEFVTYIKSGGLVGFYYVSQDAYFHWDNLFRNAGHSWVDIECDAHGRPKLPDFENVRRGFK